MFYSLHFREWSLLTNVVKYKGVILKRKSSTPMLIRLVCFCLSCINTPFIVIPVLALQSMQWHPCQLANLLILISIYCNYTFIVGHPIRWMIESQEKPLTYCTMRTIIIIVLMVCGFSYSILIFSYSNFSYFYYSRVNF